MTAARATTVRGLAVLGGGTALAAVLGLGFQSLLAFWFGAGAETDAFFMSLSIYGFLAKLLMLSHLRSLALPVYARLRGADPERARTLAGGLFGITLAGVGVLALVLFAAGPVLVDLLAPGYVGAMRDLTVLLVRIRIPALIFLAATTIAMAFLESDQRFGITVSAQKVVPAAVALGLLLVLADRAGIAAVAWIGVASTVAGALLILPVARDRLGWTGPGAAARDAEIRAIGARWAGLSGSNAATFVGEWAFRVGASLLPIGLFSAVLYGRMVHDLLHAAVNDSAQTMALPRFSAAIAAEGELGPSVRDGVAALTALSLPLALLVAATAPWTVALLFGRGRFLADGMLTPAATSLALFMVGFFLQGLVQLLFSAAFASQRSALVNRVQLIGHLARAAALVPMVLWFSYVGLVASQVAMNLLVLGLLVRWSPAQWGLGELGSRTLRSAAAAAVPTLLYLGLVAPRLPDPLSIGTAARFGVMAALGVGWAVTWLAAAAAVRLPEVGTLTARLRRPTLIGTAVLLALVTHHGAARGQSGASWGPVGEGHWSIAALEWMEARGEIPAGASSVRPLPAARVAELLGASAWAPRFAEERAAPNHVRAAVGLRLVDQGDASVRPFVSAELGSSATLPFGFVALDGRTLRRGGIGLRAGPIWAAAARDRIQLGGAATGAITLNATAHLDGVTVGTARPVSLGVLGDVSVIAAGGPLSRYQAVDDPWWGHLRLSSRPVPWLQLGLSRALLAGGYFPGGQVAFDAKPYGPDPKPMSAGDVVGAIVGRNTGYDDQVIAVDVRASLGGVGLPLLAYVEIGWEDADRSWGDPGLMAGALIAGTRPVPLAVRYEYVAFGRAARLCAWCDTLPAFWYQHVRFQSGWRAAGDLLGHPLGGYGTQHSGAATLWSPDRRIRGELRLSTIDRDRWNLLETERPGSALGLLARAAWRVHRRMDVSGSFERESGEGWRQLEWSIEGTGYF